VTRPARARLAKSLQDRAARKGTRKERLAFIDWLASSEGPSPSPTLKTFEAGAATWLALWKRRLLSREGDLPRPRRYLYIPPNPIVKIAALRRYARDHRLRVFVETGTHIGSTTAALASQFDRCFTIELSPALYERAAARLAPMTNVACLHGDSTDVLPRILRSLAEPALFWLDAHTSGGDTVHSGREPILVELAAIFSHHIKTHVILIDDARGHRIHDIFRAVPPSMNAINRNDIIRIVPIK
jgi:hypothetical protein